MKTLITKKIKENNAYFSVQWSPLKKAERYDINASVPAESGVYQLYYMDKKKRLNLIYIERVWFGGLRSTIRKMTDPELEFDPKWKSVLNQFDCYYRYTLSSSSRDMEDVLFFFGEVLFPGAEKCSSSGRYKNIFLNEESPEKFETV
ncbi:MAG: hypothetical protein J7L71_08470 [Spirochaetaceae bacterium]|nr:hypothetical protein [Spirochaetaceae bacterium]